MSYEQLLWIGPYLTERRAGACLATGDWPPTPALTPRVAAARVLIGERVVAAALPALFAAAGGQRGSSRQASAQDQQTSQPRRPPDTLAPLGHESAAGA